MAPNPQCAALAAAKDRTGNPKNYIFDKEMAHWLTGLSYAEIAQRVGSTEQRVVSSQFCILAASTWVTYQSTIQFAPVLSFRPRLSSRPSLWLWESRKR